MNSTKLHNKPLQTDERRVWVPAYCKLNLAPLAAERQAVRPTRESDKMNDGGQNHVEAVAPDVLAAIVNTGLFYPCCGQDLGVPIRLFASAVSDFYFVDIRRPRRPDIHDVARLRPSDRQIDRAETFVHLASGRDFRLHRQRDRAEAVLNALPKLGVFFFRGDNPVNGEGSSGVLWLGGDLFPQVLKLLIPGGLVVTDGSNPGPHGPRPLSAFYHDRNIGHRAMEKAVPFEYQGRRFTCIGYAGEKNGPTLIWQAA